jgi:hypothetical protein
MYCAAQKILYIEQDIAEIKGLLKRGTGDVDTLVEKEEDA